LSDAPSSTPRALRIGLFQNGQRLEERVLRRRETVTIGPDPRCTFIVPPMPRLPGRYTLFQASDRGYALCLHESIRGKVTQRGETETVADLLESSMADRDGQCRLVLDDSALGELRLGDLKVLFQFIKAPPLAARPPLPRSLRPSLRELILRDRRLWALALSSFVCHFAFVVYLRAMERPKPADIEEIPDRFVRMLVPKKVEPKKPPPLPKPDAQKQAEAKKEESQKKPADSSKPGPAKPQKSEDPAAAARAAAERQARMAEQVQNLGLLKMLTAKGPGGALNDLLKEGSGDNDAEQVFRQVGGVGPATSDPGIGAARGGGTGQRQGIGSLVASGPSSGIGTGDKTEKKVKAIVQESAPQDLDSGDLDPAAVAAKIRQYRGALVACYEAALKRNPNLSGKITLRFTVGKIGKVTKVDIEVDTMHDDEVNQCITERAINWRFPPPQSGSDGVQFAYPFIFQSSK